MILDLAQFRMEAVLFSFFRIAGLFVIAPLFSQRGIPSHLLLMFGLLMALLISPSVVQAGYAVPEHIFGVLTLAIQEFIVGVLIGFVFLGLFIGVQMAGAFIGFQMGFAIVNVIDPVTSQQISILAQFKFIIGTLIFFLLNGHHMMLEALVSSYQIVPLGESVIRFAVSEHIGRLVTGIFVIAIKVAAPVMATLILTTVGLGIISRTVPQMNIFIVGFPLRIALGLFFMGAAMPIFGYVFSKMLNIINEESYHMITLLTR